MDTLNGDGKPVVEGVSAFTEAQDSSPESKTEQPDVLKNIKAEFNRKLSKIDEKLDRYFQSVTQGKVAASVEETDSSSDSNVDVSKQVDARLAKKTHEQQFKDAVKTFPELNPGADDYDQGFYQMVDSYYTKFVAADPSDFDALQNAIELAASKTGRSEKLVREKLLKDEARRSRLIAEGGSIPKENRKEREPSLNVQGLARLGINPDKLKARLKANKDRYGE
jgi:hypothetical protein